MLFGVGIKIPTLTAFQELLFSLQKLEAQTRYEISSVCGPLMSDAILYYLMNKMNFEFQVA